MGRMAYAFAKDFLLAHNLQTDTVSTQLGNRTWPAVSFLPRAADVTGDRFIVVLGYVGNTDTSYTPCAYLLDRSNASLVVRDTWFYLPPTNTSWQASVTNWDADASAGQHDLSVSVNDAKSQVLLGIPLMNTIVILDIDRSASKFRLPSQSLSNGKAMGMGKAVGWLNPNVAGVLVNTYSLSYVWSASQIFAYDVSVANKFLVNSILPNTQQTLAPTFGPILLSLVVTDRGAMMLLDSQGNVYILLPSPAGSVSDSSTRSVSTASPCIAGTFSAEVNIFPCSLCPPGTTTSGRIGQSRCVPCDTGAFCPLGAAFGNISLSSSLLTSYSEARAYPESPQSIRFDNILMENMFLIRSSSSRHCLLVSPFFWALVAMALCMLIAVIMLILKYCVDHPHGKQATQRIKRFFKQTDLIGEGEMWAGGMASFAILILCISAYVFSSLYLQRYPIERLNGDATFACEPTLVNAQFSSGLMALNIPPNDDEVSIFRLADAQPFILTMALINTLFTCTDVTLVQVKDTNLPMPISSCRNSNGSLSLSALLPSHGINLQFQLTGAYTIGGIRLGLQGPGEQGS